LQARSLAHFETRFGEQWPTVMLAQLENGYIAGFSQVRDGKLDMLFVRPDFFCLGFGASLLADAEDRGAMRLDCFRDNWHARRFYERYGWRFVADFRQEFAGKQFDSVSYQKP
jgi:ribosomal protein S18 acetylase RimI-like enzyme